MEDERIWKDCDGITAQLIELVMKHASLFHVIYKISEFLKR